MSPSSAAAPSWSQRLSALPWQEFGVPVLVLAVVVAMVVPLPALLIDLLISANIGVSVVVLMTAMYITKPVQLSIYPTLLLLLTLFRLALNVSSSRLILLNGNTGTSAAGEMIEAFGEFVVGGNYVVGVVIFLVLIAIQYVVINHGAVRISEVTARFTLDALPGKQMAIDADLNAGLIDEAMAKERRAALSAEAEFYGAMDGASRFTQRDAVASILITAINIIAGFLIGVLQHGMDLARALTTYTVLTIGDGLVTVIPALMVSVSGGLIVTRASSETRLGFQVKTQLLSRPDPLLIASVTLFALGIVPGMPLLPFAAFGGVLGFAGWRMRQQPAVEAEAAPATPAPRSEASVESLLKVELLAVEVGLGLVRLVEGGPQSPLLRRIGALRRQLASELGYILPPVRVTDNLGLRAREYTISLKGAELARFELLPGMELAIPSGKPNARLEGTATKEPAFGLPAVWISNAQADRAKQAGHTVVDALGVLGTHLGELIRRHAHETFTRQDAKKLLDRVAEENPKAVEDLVPKLVSLTVVHKVLQALLRERVSIRDTNSIVEALGEAGAMTKNPVLLTEYTRQAIRRLVVKPHQSTGGDLAAWLLDPGLEQAVESAVEHSEAMSHLNLAPQRIREINEKVARCVPAGQGAVVLTSSGARFFLRQVLEPGFPNVTVLAHSEIPAGVRVVSLGIVQ